MSRKETNSFEEYKNMGETKITKEFLQECQENVGFQKLIERLIELNKQNYLLMLTSKGVYILEDFDIENLRNTDERISRTRVRTILTKIKKERKHMIKTTHTTKITPMNKTTLTNKTILVIMTCK